MDDLQNALDNLSLSSDISSLSDSFKLSWADQIAGFDIFDLKDMDNRKISIGDDADYLHLFMIMSEEVLKAGGDFLPLLIASDSGGNRIFVRYFTAADKKAFKYAYIALGNAANQLPESAINGKLGFFAEITLEEASGDAFEKEARKAARVMDDDVRQVWESLIDQKDTFLKTDLYVFHILKLYSWGFKAIGGNQTSSSAYHFVRAQRPKARGTSRH